MQINGYYVLGANAAWKNVMGKPIDLAVNVRNLTNKYYETGGVDLIANILGSNVHYAGPPRMVTASVTVHW